MWDVCAAKKQKKLKKQKNSIECSVYIKSHNFHDQSFVISILIRTQASSRFHFKKVEEDLSQLWKKLK